MLFEFPIYLSGTQFRNLAIPNGLRNYLKYLELNILE